HLPACMYQKHGAYYLVRKGKWERLGTDLQDALMLYAKRIAAGTQGGMPDLIDRALKHHCTHKKLSPNTVAQYEIAAERLKAIFAEFEPHQVLPKHVAAVKMDL